MEKDVTQSKDRPCDGLPSYKPTSLDFINRPNPVEPQSVPQRHPLNGTPQLSKPSNNGLNPLLLNHDGGDAERPAKRRKSGDGKLLDLPKLPVRHSAKRMRIPPTLSGLHQPPPDARILPSISTQQRVVPPGTSTQPEKTDSDGAASSVVNPQTQSDPPKAAVASVKPPARAKRIKWSDEETACLLKGVARFGIGSWTAILNCSDYHFQRRTALDLKDRFRVCRPEEYRQPRQPSPKCGRRPAKSLGTTSSRKTDRKTDSELHKLGIVQPFAKTERRKRHGYSADEDDAIMKGFRRHGKAWTAIRADEDLCLSHRTATDLRDRMRTKFPKEYAQIGLAPRPDVFPKPVRRAGIDSNTSKADAERSDDRLVRDAALSDAGEKTSETLTSEQQVAAKPPQLQFLADDTVFFGIPSTNGEDWEAERITLDRDILQWAGDGMRHSSSGTASSGTIDPLKSLKLPAPTSSFPFPSQQLNNNGGALPSVADITSRSSYERGDALELPSLIMSQYDTESRHGLDIDDLLH